MAHHTPQTPNCKLRSAKYEFVCKALKPMAEWVLPRALNFQKRKAGFTLLEMIVSIGLFVTLAVASISIMLDVSRVRRKSANLQAVTDNVRFGLELITKELRTGEEYLILSGICEPAQPILSFISNNTGAPERRAYYLKAGGIMKISLTQGDKIRQITPADCPDALPFTSDEVQINSLNFTVHGGAIGQGDGQPWVTISMEAQSRDPKIGADTHMNLQTTVTQRIRDIQ